MILIKEKGKGNLATLVKKFEKEITSGRINDYNEEATKTAFIQPFLRNVLGWNVADRDEVSPEERVSRGRVDYGLKIEGQTKIFVEVKPPKADLKKHIEQAVGYGYNRKGVPFVLLTDFEGIKLFDVTIKPDARNPLKGLKLDLDWRQYLQQFDKIWLLSKESVLNGELDKLLRKKPKDRLPVDKAILNDLKRWREKLAKDIFKNNTKLFHSQDREKDADYLKEITQRIIDRIMFMRSCEDRKLIHRRSLKELFEERTETVGTNTMVFLEEEFKRYNDIFDSDLFRPQDWERDLAVDFKVMRDIILETYNPYQFDVIPLEVLGNIYEQYLGYTIRLTDHQVKYELKPEVRKAGGIYYTPEYIVDYIVKNTVGKLLKELPAKKIKKLRILDPACGSGSFLIRAYEEMLNYYRSQKKKKPKYKKGQEELGLKEEETEPILTIGEKSKILCEHIFGVDIDEQAVEVTKLSLMLKMLEGEFGIIPGRSILPMLDRNIRCGNSLISGDTLELKKYFGEDWYKVKPFNWKDSFRKIMVDEGGFDVVIGNPPYVNVENLDASVRNFLMDNYETAIKRFDIYISFIEKGLNLLKKGGMTSYIIPYPFLNQNYAEMLRNKILDEYELLSIVDLSDIRVFGDAVIRNCITIIRKPMVKQKLIEEINILHATVKVISDIPEITKLRTIHKIFIKRMPKQMFRLDIDELDTKILKKIDNQSFKLGSICYINWGARTGNIKKYVITKAIDHRCKRMINARNIDRYSLKWTGDYLWYKKDELYNPMFEELFDNEKIIVRDISGKARLKATFDNRHYYAEHTVSLCVSKHLLLEVNRRGIELTPEESKKSKKYDLKFILAIINSRLINYYFQLLLGGGLHVYPNDVKKLPIRTIDFNNSSEKKVHNDIVALVNVMLDLNKKIQTAKGSKKKQIQRQIEKTDGEIDDLVYELYGITEERKVIEGKEI